MRGRMRSVVGGGIGLCVLLAGCSAKADTAASSSGDGSGVKANVGVTEDTITIGVLTDLAGPFKTNGLAMTAGNEIWADHANEDGGICGREIVLDIKDAGYKAENAMALFEEQKSTTLGYAQLVGSHIIAALKSKLSTDGIFTIAAAVSSMNMDDPAIQVLSATNDIEVLNGLAYMKQEGKLSDGGTIAHVYLDSEFGQNSLQGSTYYAQQHDLDVIEIPVGATDTDMTAALTKIKSDGADLIVLSTAASGAGSVVLQNAVQGLNLPIIANSSSFAPNLLTDPAMAEAMKNVTLASGWAPVGAEGDLAQTIKSAYEEKYDDPTSFALNAGYVYGLTWQAVLEKACELGDLTREGVLKAKEQVDQMDTDGLSGTFDLSDYRVPTTRQTFMLVPDASVIELGGLTIVDELAASEEAKSYKAPHQK